MKSSLLHPGKNCWRKEKTSRASVLIDGDEYFCAFFHAARKAKKYILISGWEMDSRVDLLRGMQSPDGEPTTLGSFLNHLARQNPELEIFILSWDYSMIFIMERQPLPAYHLGWTTHRRIHFHLDKEHPIGASHHQKIVVVDGKIAFTGGLDLTKRRWDTPEHRLDDNRRTDPGGDFYFPFHDVQILMEGDSAAAVTEIFQTRWLRATGKKLQLSRNLPSDPWPDGWEPDFTGIRLGIARTEPTFKGRPEIREIEKLYQDAIGGAEEIIYMENQYFSSPTIRDALVASLRKKQGPEIIFVLPERSSGWLEETTLDSLRDKNLTKLRENDAHARFGVFYPTQPGLDGGCIKVHSKVFTADDEFLMIGSANLSNRSMGLDTELNVAVEAEGDERIRASIRRIRERLLGEHLGLEGGKLEEIQESSLLNTILSRKDAPRTLRDFSHLLKERNQFFPVDPELLDPEKPIPFDRFMDGFVPRGEEDGKGYARLIKIGVVVTLLLIMAALWRWTPLSQYLKVETFLGWTSFLQTYSSLAPFMVFAAFLIGGLLMFPVTVLIAATSAIFEPPRSILFCYAGSLSSAVLVYFIGRWLGRDTVRNLTGTWLSRLSRQLSKRGRGLATITVIRMLPIAPFTVINIVAGALHIRFWHYFLGTILGMSPGIIGISIFTDRLISFLQHPDLGNFFLLLGAGIILVILGVWIKKRLTR